MYSAIQISMKNLIKKKKEKNVQHDYIRFWSFDAKNRDRDENLMNRTALYERTLYSGAGLRELIQSWNNLDAHLLSFLGLPLCVFT